MNDVGSMSLMPIDHCLPSKYFIGLLNSNLLFDYYRVFVNCSVNIQINDLRQIPIVIPQESDLCLILSLVDKAVNIKKIHQKADDLLNNSELIILESKINLIVNRLYSIEL